MKIVTREEALASGVSEDGIRRRVRSGKWQQVFPRVYLTSPIPASREQRIIAACKWAGPSAVASYSSARELWKLPGARPGLIEVTTTRDLRSRCNEVVIHRVPQLTMRDRTVIGTIPVTTPIRTILDSAADLDEGPLIHLVHKGFKNEIVTFERLMRALRKDLSGRRGIVELRRILEEGLDSYLERMLKGVLDNSPFNWYVPQYEVEVSGGRSVVIDFAFPRERLAVEADGWEFHSNHEAFQRDRKKWRELARLGWLVQPFTYEDVKFNPPGVLEDIGAALANNAVTQQADRLDF